MAFEGPNACANAFADRSANACAYTSTHGCANACTYYGQSGISNLLFEGTDGWRCPSCEGVLAQPISDFVV